MAFIVQYWWAFLIIALFILVGVVMYHEEKKKMPTIPICFLRKITETCPALNLKHTL